MLVIGLVVIIIVLVLSIYLTITNKISGGSENTKSDAIKHLIKNVPSSIKDKYKKLVEKVYNDKKSKPFIMFDDIPESLPYVEHGSIYSVDNHFGQRKLFLNEVQFLTRRNIKEPSICVYAGAAPSHKGAFLASLFPNVKFLLVDPNPFEIKPYDNIKIETIPIDGELIKDNKSVVEKAFESDSNICIINGFMTSQLGKAIGDYVEKHPIPLYFVSDVRTNMDKSTPTSLDIVWNSSQQYNWICNCKPIASMLKFRSPFFTESDKEFAEYSEKIKSSPYNEDFEESKRLGVDFEEALKNKELVYFDGDVYLQPWAPVSSTETRLVIDHDVPFDKPKMVPYPAKNYEETLFYYNKVVRNFQMFENPNTNRGLGFDHCADCAIENTIWTEYLEGKGEKVNSGKIAKFVSTISKIISRPLLNTKTTRSIKHPGKMFQPDPSVLIKNVDQYAKTKGKKSSYSQYAKMKNKHRGRL